MMKVLCLDDGNEYFFEASTSLEAIEKMGYTLTLMADDAFQVRETHRTYYIVHRGKTYATLK